MTAPKSFTRYSSYWMEIFDAFKAKPHEPIEVPCKDEREAKSLRLEFYKARAAALQDESWKQEYGAVLNDRETRVEGNVLIFDTKDNGWVARLLKGALNTIKQKD